MANPLQGRETEPLYYAGMSRARVDWLVGMNLSRLYTLLGRAAGGELTLHVGRVVTPKAALVRQLDKSIDEFVPSPFYEVTANILSLADILSPNGFAQRTWAIRKVVA